jgi:hypothetical protein
MNSGDILSILDTPPAKAIASLIAVLVSPLGKLFGGGRAASLDEIKAILETRKLLDPSDPDYQTLSSMAHESIAHLTRTPSTAKWKDKIGEMIVYFVLVLVLCYFAADLYEKHHPWWAGILAFYALGAVINLAGLFTGNGTDSALRKMLSRR